VDPIGPDNAVPEPGREHRLDGDEEGPGQSHDSAGSLLSIKVRRRMPHRPRNDAAAAPKPNTDLRFPPDHNGQEVEEPEGLPARPTPQTTVPALDSETGSRDPLFDSGPKRPAEPPRRRRPDEIVTYWSHLRAGRRFPALADIDLGRIATEWPNSLMIRRRAGSRVLEAERIGGARPASGSPRNDDESEARFDVSPLMLQWLLSLAGEVTKTRRPMGDTESFPSLRKSVGYRAFALPLSDDQKEIDHILCHVCLEE